MKKFTAILAAIVLALFVVSCGGGSNNDKDKDPTDPTSTEPTEEPTSTEPTDPTSTEPTEPTSTEPTDPTSTEPTEPPVEGCKLGNLMLPEELPARYFAFKGSGTINANINSQDAEPASLVSVQSAGMDGANFQFANQLSFFEFGPSQSYQGNPDSVQLTVYGDVDTTTYHVLTVAQADILVDYMEYMKENETYELAQAPLTNVAVLKWTSDSNYVQQCIFYGRTDETKQMFLGNMKVCYDKNVDFNPGETFKLNMFAEIGSDEETAGLFTDIESVEDLCPCFLIDDAHPNGEQVDCNTIPEFANGEPTDPTEPALTCNAEEHKELNEAGDACVCMTGYTENAETHVCEAPALTCNAEEHKELNEAGDACVCMTGYTENAETHVCEAE